MWGAAPCTASGIPPHAIIAYQDSWNDVPVASAADSTLATLPDYISVIDLAFANPALIYPGDLNLSQTGLQYRVPGWFLRDAIALLKTRNPHIKVLLSVGGAAYTDWQNLNEAAVVHLVGDLGADGVDIDFEPQHPGCAAAKDAHVQCATDPLWGQLVERFRAVLPRPAVLTAAVWSVGAYGEGAFRDARPPSRYTGLMLHFLYLPHRFRTRPVVDRRLRRHTRVRSDAGVSRLSRHLARPVGAWPCRGTPRRQRAVLLRA